MDLMPILLLLSVTDTRKFQKIRDAVNRAEGFQETFRKVSQLSAAIPALNAMQGTGQSADEQKETAYQDTLAGLISRLR